MLEKLNEEEMNKELDELMAPLQVPDEFRTDCDDCDCHREATEESDSSLHYDVPGGILIGD